MASEPTTLSRIPKYLVAVSAKDATQEFECAEGERILYAGLRAGLALPYECATGTCGTCKASVASGETTYLWPEAPGRRYTKTDRNEVLMCQSTAHSPVSLKIFKFVDERGPRYVPRNILGTVTCATTLVKDVLTFDVRLDEPVSFEAGQFVVLQVDAVPGGRSYSMVNFEPEARELRFLVKRFPGGRLTEWLFSTPIEGVTVRLFGPLGRATFDPTAAKHIVCIAGGSGIAGMMSMLSHGALHEHFSRHDARIYFGVRTPQDAFYLGDLQTYPRRFPGKVRVTVAFSHAEPTEEMRRAYPELDFTTGFIHEVAKASLGAAPADTMVYVAGPPPMVEAALRMLLLELKVSGSDIRYDKFS